MTKVQIGIIGTGWWAVENHIPVLQSREDVEIAAICRLGDEELRRAQSQFSIPFGTEDYHELLALSHLDGVVVSSPHHLHYEHSLESLRRGLHVLCEKPMSLSAQEAFQLAGLAQSQSLHFLIPYGWNYSDFAAIAKGKIKQGAIGQIQYVQCHMASALRDLFSGKKPWFADQSFFKPEAKTWSDPSTGGGFANGQLTHALALLLWITGLEPSEVFALMGLSATGADLFDSISCRFKSSATGTFGGAATMPPGSTYQIDIRIFGTEGMLLLDIERPRLEIRRNDGEHFSMPMTISPGAYECATPLHTFIDLIQGKPVENCSTAQLGAHVVEIIEAAFRSAKSRSPEKVWAVMSSEQL